jgi:hypothetical protein
MSIILPIIVYLSLLVQHIYQKLFFYLLNNYQRMSFSKDNETILITLTSIMGITKSWMKSIMQLQHKYHFEVLKTRGLE